MSSVVKPPASYNDFGSLKALGRDAKTGSAGSIRETARQFESLFTRMVLKSVRDANLGDPLFGDDAMKSYEEMYDDQLSVQLTAGKGIGLAEMLVRQLSRGVGTASGTGAAAGGTAAAGADSGGAESVAGVGIAVPAGAPGRGRKGSPYAPGSAAVAPATAAGAATTPTAATAAGAPIRLAAEGEIAPAVAAAEGAAKTHGAAVDGAVAAEGAVSAEAMHAAFVQELWPGAVQAGERLGVDPRTLIAHAALETGWGRSLPGGAAQPCSNNLFGIKAGGWSGASVASRTLEFDGGVAKLRTERFRAYASTADCFQDYVTLLRGSPRYAAALGTGSNAAAFGAALQQGGYATDPRYASKLAAVANSLKQMASPPLTASQGGT